MRLYFYMGENKYERGNPVNPGPNYKIDHRGYVTNREELTNFDNNIDEYVIGNYYIFQLQGFFYAGELLEVEFHERSSKLCEFINKTFTREILYITENYVDVVMNNIYNALNGCFDAGFFSNKKPFLKMRIDHVYICEKNELKDICHYKLPIELLITPRYFQLYDVIPIYNFKNALSYDA